MLARQLLNSNYVNNRPIRKLFVNIWTKLINDGQFTLGSQIRMAQNGTDQVLIDGQHRLMAIVETGKTQTCNLLTVEVDDISREYAITDSNNLRRSPSDSLNAIVPDSGLNPTSINKMIAGIKLIRNGLNPNKRRENWSYNRPQMAEFAKPWIPIMRSYLSTVSHTTQDGKMPHILLRASSIAFGLITVRQQPTKATVFWDGISHDEGMFNDDPRRVLRRYLVDSTSFSNKETQHAIGTMASAWNAFYLNEKVHRLRSTKDLTHINGIDVYEYLPK